MPKLITMPKMPKNAKKGPTMPKHANNANTNFEMTDANTIV